MKTKIKKEFYAKTIPELRVTLKEAKDVIFSLRLEKAQKKLKNLRAIFNKRKEMAVIKTFIRGKELADVKNT